MCNNLHLRYLISQKLSMIKIRSVKWGPANNKTSCKYRNDFYFEGLFVTLKIELSLNLENKKYNIYLIDMN